MSSFIDILIWLILLIIGIVCGFLSIFRVKYSVALIGGIASVSQITVIKPYYFIYGWEIWYSISLYLLINLIGFICIVYSEKEYENLKHPKNSILKWWRPQPNSFIGGILIIIGDLAMLNSMNKFFSDYFQWIINNGLPSTGKGMSSFIDILIWLILLIIGIVCGFFINI